jgi:hypothetical protein
MIEKEIEQALIEKLGDLKYIYRSNICDCATLEQNFREKFEALNRLIPLLHKLAQVWDISGLGAYE